MPLMVEYLRTYTERAAPGAVEVGRDTAASRAATGPGTQGAGQDSAGRVGRLADGLSASTGAAGRSPAARRRARDRAAGLVNVRAAGGTDDSPEFVFQWRRRRRRIVGGAQHREDRRRSAHRWAESGGTPLVAPQHRRSSEIARRRTRRCRGRSSVPPAMARFSLQNVKIMSRPPESWVSVLPLSNGSAVVPANPSNQS